MKSKQNKIKRSIGFDGSDSKTNFKPHGLLSFVHVEKVELSWLMYDVLQSLPLGQGLFL